MSVFTPNKDKHKVGNKDTNEDSDSEGSPIRPDEKMLIRSNLYNWKFEKNRIEHYKTN